MSRKFNFEVGEVYHIYGRGVEKRSIFEDKRDHERFQRCLYLYNSHKSNNYRDIELAYKDIFSFRTNKNDLPLVAIAAYCLMPNHFHLLVKEIEPGGISKFMGKVLTSYSMYFNKKHSRTGSLFEGVFRAVHANRDEYLKYLYSYIHLNPVSLVDKNWKDKKIDKAKAKDFLLSYPYSSYTEYISDFSRKEGKILNTQVFPDYFDTNHSFEKYITEWLNFSSPLGEA